MYIMITPYLLKQINHKLFRDYTVAASSGLREMLNKINEYWVLTKDGATETRE